MKRKSCLHFPDLPVALAFRVICVINAAFFGHSVIHCFRRSITTAARSISIAFATANSGHCVTRKSSQSADVGKYLRNWFVVTCRAFAISGNKTCSLKLSTTTRRSCVRKSGSSLCTDVVVLRASIRSTSSCQLQCLVDILAANTLTQRDTLQATFKACVRLRATYLAADCVCAEC